MALSLVMPGPNEPSDYALEQIMEPLIEELLELQQGETSINSITCLHTFQHSLSRHPFLGLE
jgi:hypothetical protein